VIARTGRTLDLEERTAAVLEAQRLIYDRDPAVLNIVSPYDYAAFHTVLHNIPDGLGTTERYLHTMWTEHG
jgi:hypothetical protein